MNIALRPRHIIWILCVSFVLTAPCFPALAIQAPHLGGIGIAPQEKDFGVVFSGSTVKAEFAIRNTGDTVLELAPTAFSGCGCTKGKVRKTRLLPGDVTALDVEFDTRGYRGNQTRRFYVKSDDTIRPLVEVKLVGVVVPLLTWKNRLLLSPESRYRAQSEVVVARFPHGENEELRLQGVSDSSHTLEAQIVPVSVDDKTRTYLVEVWLRESLRDFLGEPVKGVRRLAIATNPSTPEPLYVLVYVNFPGTITLEPNRVRVSRREMAGTMTIKREIRLAAPNSDILDLHQVNSPDTVNVEWFRHHDGAYYLNASISSAQRLAERGIIERECLIVEGSYGGDAFRLEIPILVY